MLERHLKRIAAEGKSRGASGTGNQSIVWQAFWIPFGELDPVSALAAVRNLGSLQYFGLEFGEKISSKLGSRRP